MIRHLAEKVMFRTSSRLLPVLLALLLIGPFCFHVISETDTGWHLALGRLIVTSGIPDRNALSWTAPNEPWYATSWLFDLLAATFTMGFGVLGLQCFSFALVALTLIGLMLACRRAAPGTGAWAVPLTALMLIPRVTERPDLASRAVLAWVLWLCTPAAGEQLSDRDRSWRRRLAAVGLIAFGSNLHSGVVFPSILLAIFCTEAFLFAGRRPREIVLAGAGFLALLANPGGLFNVAYVFKHLRVQSVIRLQEFETPGLHRAAVFYAVILFATFFAWRERRKLPAILVMTVAFAAFGIWALRLMYEFEVVATLPLALGISCLHERYGRRIQFGLTVLALLVLVWMRSGWFRRLEVAPRFDEKLLPVRAAEFIRAEHLDGRLFNAFRDGGYLEWALPGLPTFQDARVQAWPPAFFEQEQEAEKAPAAFRQWLRELDVEWAVASRVQERLAGHEQFNAPDWALIYWDDATEIFVRRDVARLAPIVARLEYRHFHPQGAFMHDLATAPPAELLAWRSELDRFERTTPHSADAVLERCGVLTRLAEPGAEDACREAEGMLGSDRGRAAVRSLRTMSAATR